MTDLQNSCNELQYPYLPSHTTHYSIQLSDDNGGGAVQLSFAGEQWRHTALFVSHALATSTRYLLVVPCITAVFLLCYCGVRFLFNTCFPCSVLIRKGYIQTRPFIFALHVCVITAFDSRILADVVLRRHF